MGATRPACRLFENLGQFELLVKARPYGRQSKRWTAERPCMNPKRDNGVYGAWDVPHMSALVCIRDGSQWPAYWTAANCPPESVATPPPIHFFLDKTRILT